MPPLGGVGGRGCGVCRRAPVERVSRATLWCPPTLVGSSLGVIGGVAGHAGGNLNWVVHSCLPLVWDDSMMHSWLCCLSTWARRAGLYCPQRVGLMVCPGGDVWAAVHLLWVDSVGGWTRGGACSPPSPRLRDQRRVVGSFAGGQVWVA